MPSRRPSRRAASTEAGSRPSRAPSHVAESELPIAASVSGCGGNHYPGRVRRLLVVGLLAAVAAGCGSGKSASTTTTSGPPDPASAVGGHTIYQGTEWAVVVKGNRATALRLVGDTWQPDRSGRVKIELLGPRKTETRVFQVAAQLSATSPLVES